MSCHICLEDLNIPVSLPCGHVFCHECLKRAVEAVQPYSTLHACPTCRSHYHLAPLDVSVVPHHLQPHLAPSIRKIYIDLPPSKTQIANASKSPPPYPSAEIARLRAENEALRYNCFLWRRRAEAHSAMTLGLLRLSQMAQEQTLQVAGERDRIYKAYQQQRVVMRTMETASPQNMPGPTSQLTFLVSEPNLGGTTPTVNTCVSACPGRNSPPSIAKLVPRKRSRAEESEDEGRAMTRVETVLSSGSDATITVDVKKEVS